MVYVLLAEGFEEVEALTPVDIMRRAGISVTTVSISSNLSVTGSHNIKVFSDCVISDCDFSDMELLMIPGGPGHTVLDESAEFEKVLKTAVDSSVYVAAICASPSLLGKRGYLQGKKATAFPGFEKYLKGATVLNEKAVKDGKFITGKGAGASAEFGFLIVETLLSKDAANELRNGMQY